MNTEIIIQLITIGVLSAGVIIAYCDFKKELKKQRKEEEMQTTIARLSFFSEYTKRYSEIMLGLPNCVHEKQFVYSEHDKTETEMILRYMRIYFDLCSEEFYLFSQGYIEENVWKDWKEGIEMALKKDAFKIAWENLYKNKKTIESQFYIDFNKEILEMIDQNNKKQI